MKKPVCPSSEQMVQEALAYKPPADIKRLIPSDFIEQVMAKIRKIGPLRKISPTDDKTTGG